MPNKGPTMGPPLGPPFELKSCPFCGGAAGMTQYADSGPSADLFFVGCENCGCEVDSFVTKQRAVRWWNTRVDETSIRRKALLEAAKVLCKHCRKDMPQCDNDQDWWHESCEFYCTAPEIHDLLTWKS
jgi:Lar family restriction alleviation protein